MKYTKRTICKDLLSIIVFAYNGIFTACATYELQVANVSMYHDGVQIADSIKAKSKVRLEVGQTLVGSANVVPLALFISAVNLSTQNVIFDKSNIVLYQHQKIIAPLNEKELKGQNLDLGYIIESYHLFIPSAPMPSQPMSIPIIYRGYMGGFYIYDEMIFSARERMRRQIELDEQRMRRAIILSSMLQKNTLEPKSAPRGGFMIYSPSSLQKGQAELKVRVGEDEHIFILNLKSKGK